MNPSMKNIILLKSLLIALFAFSPAAKAQFKSEESLAINLTGGNADLKTYNLSSKNSYTFDPHKFTLNGLYLYGESNSVRSAENWSFGLRYDYSFTAKISLYFGELVESDRFAGVSRRYNSDLGGVYSFIKEDTKTFFTEVGLRYTIEKPSDDTQADRKDFKGRIYFEGTNRFREGLTGKFWIEYLPNFTVSEDYLVNFEPSLTFTLSESFSLKSSYLWKYDNLPIPENRKHDYQYQLTLIAQF
jgi:putative salt-induced outer membrane protein